jgi:NAD(P)-dependent dehydrogenase (short-subunit alcohol dehydrogenase family)
MLEVGAGSIINVSSMASVQGFPGTPAYTASKGAMNALTRSIAADYGTRGVRANTIVIGVIVNELTAAIVSTPEREAVARSLHFTTRLGQCSDSSHLGVYLGSDESEFITACEFRVDGGTTMKGPLITDPANYTRASA